MLKAIAFLPFITSSLTTPTAMVETSLVTPSYTIRNENNIILDVPFINQKESLLDTDVEWSGGSSCGPASLTMAINFLGDKRTHEDVVKILPESVYIRGKMFYDLPYGGEVLGYEAKTIDINTTQIYNTLKDGYPIILNVQNYDGVTGHAVVVVGIKGYDGEKAQSLIVHDPFRTEYREFEYIDEKTLKQPEGYTLPIGILKPFYLTKTSQLM